MKNKRYEQQQIDAWLYEWKASGLNPYQFSLRKPFAASTIGKWIKKASEIPSNCNPVGFLQLDIQTKSPEANLVIYYPNGIKVDIHCMLDAKAIKTLIGC
jgi:hypothetical protein